MKRFWKEAKAVPSGGGFAVELDGRPLHTPGRERLVVPTAALADAVAGEWNHAADKVDPRVMPMTGLANAAIDRVAPDPAAFAQSLVRYADSDLVCYRAHYPPALVDRQAARWDPLIAWARRRYDVDVVTTGGIVHVAQPKATLDRLAHAVNGLDAFRLAGIAPLVTIGGSLIAGLAVAEGAVEPETAWEAVSVDDEWQRDQWGADPEAEAALEGKRREFAAASAFLALLGISEAR